jgi:hypothetical protein
MEYMKDVQKKEKESLSVKTQPDTSLDKHKYVFIIRILGDRNY